MSGVTPFRIRCSKIGYYIRCPRRLVNDILVHHGMAAAVADGGTSSPADFGTVAHWIAQTGIRACFKSQPNDFRYTGWDQVSAEAARYTQEQFDNGAKLFHDGAAAMATLMTVAADVAQRLPTQPGTHARITEWLAESVIDTPTLTGHIDLLSGNIDDLVDIKTTGSKPARGQMKTAHFWQLMGYGVGIRRVLKRLPKRGHVLYVHNRGEWAFRSKPIDFDDPKIISAVDFLDAWVNKATDFAALPDLLMTATPAISDDCRSDFCPYTCGDLIPDGVAVMNRAPVVVETPSLFAP